ncbi:type IV secretion/conjugal transfer ATPase, VirB4 family [Limihaloglobus sulfuriphilus]|uniref:Type IV secretion/conjugal transfer ATPase, VirB4 family n=1 Tax=Limihaloglobus sulfuriphilus TaxID=1851148 RepID=A0A1Q2MFT2_9BACT|nr:ATP-binding protein [Limihaloglobus sulfuriphilus]AQQ71408.1 type IV secretion/conjugal transfer ATPase, VirB4 family [Limihaloglobus sulfuriphilus]
MNIEKLARWLEPIIPDKIKTWMKARDMGDISMRQLIEKQIISTAYRIFGDPRKAMILSLPPYKITNKPIKLGNVWYDHKRQVFGLNYEQLLQHTAIFGRSGAGKSNIVMNIFRQLIGRDMPTLFLDWKRNGREILPHVTKKVNVYTAGRKVNSFPFNPFIPPPGVELNVYIQHVVDVMAEAYTLGDGARSLIQKALVSANMKLGVAPSVDQLIDELELISESSKSDKSRSRGWKTTAMRALEELKLANLTGGSSKEQQMFTIGLATSINVIELDSLSISTRKFIIPLLFSWIYQVKLSSSQREKLSLVLILEEAHNVLYRTQRSTETLTEQLLRQAREIGIGVILVDQQPSQISPTVLGNVHTSVIMNLKDPADITKAAGLSLLDDTEKYYLTRLEIGVGIVKLQSTWQRPFIVSFDHLKLDKGKITDEVLLRLAQGKSPRFPQRQGICTDTGRGSRGRLADTGFAGVEDGVLLLVNDIIVHPDDGVRVRYKRIGLSVGKANRLKQELLVLGWIRQRAVAVGITRKVILEIADEGKRVFGLPTKLDAMLHSPVKPEKNGRIDVGLVIDHIQASNEDNKLRKESMEHAYWKYRYAKKLAELGYTVQVEAPVGAGFADLAAQKGQERLIFEIETGSSDFVKNLTQGLQLADTVVMVATSEMAMQRIEKTLAKKGLLIQGRVEMVLKDKSRYFKG